MSSFVVSNHSLLIFQDLFHLFDHSLVSCAFSSLLFNFFCQEPDSFFILFLFLGKLSSLSVELIGNSDFLIQHFLHFLKFSLISHGFPSLLFNSIPYVTNFIVIFRSNSIILNQLFFLFFDHSFKFSDGCLICKTLVPFLLKFISNRNKLFLIS